MREERNTASLEMNYFSKGEKEKKKKREKESIDHLFRWKKIHNLIKSYKTGFRLKPHFKISEISL